MGTDGAAWTCTMLVVVWLGAGGAAIALARALRAATPVRPMSIRIGRASGRAGRAGAGPAAGRRAGSGRDGTGG